MKKSILALSIIAMLFVANLSLTSCNGKKAEQQEQTEGKDSGNSDSTAMAYACPMHPEVTGKEGDKCSKCGMNLEAVKNSDSTAVKN